MPLGWISRTQSSLVFNYFNLKAWLVVIFIPYSKRDKGEVFTNPVRIPIFLVQDGRNKATIQQEREKLML